MTTTQSVNSKKVYYKELVCMNCGDVHTHEIPFGIEWNKHIKVCDKCGCSRFSDYYKNIDNFRPAPKYDFNRGPWMNLPSKEEIEKIMEFNDLMDIVRKHDRNMLDCRGVDVSQPKYNPTEQLTTMMDSIPDTNLQDVINRGGYGR